MTTDEIKAKHYEEMLEALKEAHEILKSAPMYVRIGPDGCVMKLKHSAGHDNWTYWRPAGLWGCEIDFKDGKFYSHMPLHPNLHNIEMVPATKEEYLQDNKGYV